tara:strand:- start:448 stop:2217 length:1770 start_codon:yes stop_codon:yes gene_type:complete
MTYTKSLISKLWENLTKRRKNQLIILLLIMLISGLSELITLTSVIPFLTVLTKPENLFKFSFIKQIANLFSISQPKDMILPIVFIFIFCAIISASIRLFNLWFNLRLAASIGSDLSRKAYKSILEQSYEYHLNLNSSKLISSVTNHTDKSVAAINSLLFVITNIIIGFAIFIGLFLIDYKIAFYTIVLFGFIYFSIAKIIKKQVNLNSKIIASKTQLVLKSLQEGFGSIRDIILDCNQETYINIYKKADRPKRLMEAKNMFLSNSPRFAVEGIGLVVIALVSLLLINTLNEERSIIVILGGLALAAQKLLPAVQQTYGNWINLEAYSADLNALLEMLNLRRSEFNYKKTIPLILKDKITFDSVCYSYSGNKPYVVSNINLEIFKSERIGIIGKTGSGKSTMIDIFMGLIKPIKGTVYIDGKDIYKEDHSKVLFKWRKSIAHVPQNIYLADSSIAENIAFGVSKNEISMNLVKEAAKKAQIHSFIESLKNGYHTTTGERGIKLSGGQRQRLGIARALYKKAKILVFDEATSALDNETELATINAIDGLDQELTIIMIAHRMSTLRKCTKIIRLEEGFITRIGKPRDLLDL